jgi:tellurite resistance protein
VPRLIPLNFFSIPFGLVGLAGCWLVAAMFGLAPVAIGRVLVAVALIAWLIVPDTPTCEACAPVG